MSITPLRTALSLADLTGLVREIGTAEDFWIRSLRLPTGENRWWGRLWHDDDVDVWLLSWLPGHTTDLHDHGDSAAAFTVVRGQLRETRVEAGRRVRFDRVVGHTTWVAPGVVHDVHGAGNDPAVSIHAYSPPLQRMNYYDALGRRIVRSVATDEPEQELQRMTTAAVRSVDDLLARARTRLARLDPWEAYQAAGEGAVLVDTRPQLNRELEGVIPDALIIERNVLEWRVDLFRDARVIVFCNEGYASSLAAVSLHDLGVHRATDMVGGYRAWRASGLPTQFPAFGDCA